MNLFSFIFIDMPHVIKVRDTFVDATLTPEMLEHINGQTRYRGSRPKDHTFITNPLKFVHLFTKHFNVSWTCRRQESFNFKSKSVVYHIILFLIWEYMVMVKQTLYAKRKE